MVATLKQAWYIYGNSLRFSLFFGGFTDRLRNASATAWLITAAVAAAEMSPPIGVKRGGNGAKRKSPFLLMNFSLIPSSFCRC